jgi:ABC-type proline/glycine betaine transport system ATPase subunit
MVDGFVADWKRAGRTILLATHRRGLAVRAADRVAVLVAGRLRRYCLPEELDRADLASPGAAVPEALSESAPEPGAV